MTEEAGRYYSSTIADKVEIIRCAVHDMNNGGNGRHGYFSFYRCDDSGEPRLHFDVKISALIDHMTLTVQFSGRDGVADELNPSEARVTCLVYRPLGNVKPTGSIH